MLRESRRRSEWLRAGSLERGAGAGLVCDVVVRVGALSGGRGERSSARERVDERGRPVPGVVDA